jgi:hypothetical protein
MYFPARIHLPPNTILCSMGRELATIHDFRQRYGQYRTDASLLSAHLNAPWITVWDDHEVLNAHREDYDFSASSRSQTIRGRQGPRIRMTPLLAAPSLRLVLALPTENSPQFGRTTSGSLSDKCRCSINLGSGGTFKLENSWI